MDVLKANQKPLEHTMRRRLFLLVVLAAAASAGELPELAVTGSTTADARVWLNGRQWFANRLVSLNVAGRLYSTAPGAAHPLRLLASTNSTGVGPWGSYQAVQAVWLANKTRMITKVLLYHAADALVFSQSFPDGVSNPPGGDKNGVLSGFPVFAPETVPGPQRLWMGYNGWDCDEQYGCVHSQAQRVALGQWDNGTAVLPYGLEGSGPLVVMNSSGESSVVISAASSFMVASQQYTAGGPLSFGVMGSVTEIPANFSVEFVMVAGRGPNHAVRRWGSLLRSRYKKSNPEGKDLTTAKLGYDTDNGAFYYYNPEPGKTYAQTLMDVKADAEQKGLPFRHVQLDSWWYIKGAGGGTKTWSPGPNTFPDGLAVFSNATGWKITAHNRMWSSEVTYARQNGGDYPWLINGTEAVPTSQAFWNWLMASAKSWGLVVYEQDWLFTEFVGSQQLLGSAGLARDWLMQMGQAAEANGIAVQYCMLWPRMALQSLELPAVTTARASTDYGAGKNDQWVMGLSSLFLDSLALRPTKDNFFSTDHQGKGNPKGIEHFSRLQSLVSTLSTGPVFPSDAIGCSDPKLIMRSCTEDGSLLKPDRAATNLDSNILSKALARASGSTEPGELQSTTATVSGVQYSLLLAANSTAYNMTLAELIPEAASGARFAAFESNSTGSLELFDSTHPIRIRTNDRWSFEFWTVAPELGHGMFFLGEQDEKWVAVSPQRFVSIEASQPGQLQAKFVGEAGEPVQLAWAWTGTGTGADIHRQSVICKVGSDGFGRAILNNDGSNQCMQSPSN